ncbi:NO-inducible flavohemoprotein [Parahaliea mediterranea]|uniref:NO-inducible flavohemoprotein n=1 Tax=Parahaliea mediterranea TaxID=651086 RepID=UPI000E2E91A8|nr:NO-inducible flavohemoprotein [Parahaliea mediterranea]
MLDAPTIDIIKATVPAVQQHAEQITQCFYPLMFERYPEVIPYFNQSHQGSGSQPRALANAVVAYAANIDNLGVLDEAVGRIVQKHCALGIQPEQYPIVGECLLAAIAEVLGEAATPEILAAWGAAYGQLADLLIGAEESVYTANEEKPGGWRGARAFELVRREQESEVITSFYFKPCDGGSLPDYAPGQFITVLLDIDGQSVRRNYSLSDAPGGDAFRISVKREPEGLVSGFLHERLQAGDRVNLLPPCGDFVLRDSERPLVLLTGGVGITPAISMLNSAIGSGRRIHFIHAALNSGAHAFRGHVDALAAANDNLNTCYVYNEPRPECRPHAQGLVSAELVADQLGGEHDVDYYFLGPKPFMVQARRIAEQLGVPAGQVHFEFFGPAEDLVA